jgi:hypothetical protein
MRKGLYLVLSLLVVFSLGTVLLHCGDDDPKCESGQECCQDVPECPEGQVCNFDTNTCDPICGTDECCEDLPDCPAGTRCDFANGTCGDCCADAPAGEYHIWVSGMTIDMTTQQPAAAAVAAISPMDALTNPDPTKLSDQVTGADGLYKTDCINVTEVAIGLVMMTDDIGWDGAAGTYFPTGSGAKGWDNNSEKYCAPDTKTWLVPSALVAGLDAATSVDSAGFGFVMGLVVDVSTGSAVPVDGAVLKKGDGTDLVEVIYPNATLTAFDGTATSANGMFILPHTNFALGITEINAEKAGMTFGAEQAAPKAGFCYFVYIMGM